MNLSKNAPKSGLLLISFFFVPLTLLLFQPILFPFADDWLIIENNSATYSPSFNQFFQTVNGHQVALSKALLKLLSYLSPYDLRLVAASSMLFGLAGLFLLVKSQLLLLNKRDSLFALTTLATIGFSYKQMQNFFMPICNGWMLALFFVGLYYFNKQLPNSSKKTTFLCISILLAPFCIGLGMILAFVELIEFSYRFLIKNRKVDLTLTLSSKVTAIFATSSICFYFLYNHLPLDDISGVQTRFQFSTFFNVILHPLVSIKFILALVGSIFVPSSRLDPNLSILGGMIFLIISIYFLSRFKQNIHLNHILLNKSPLLGGAIFLVLLCAFRFSGNREDLLNATAPRYVSGTLLLVMGIFSIILNQVTYEKSLKGFLVLVCVFVLISGIKTGTEWHATRYEQSKILVNCTKDEFLDKSSNCYNLAILNSMTPNELFFQKQLLEFEKGKSYAKK